MQALYRRAVLEQGGTGVADGSTINLGIFDYLGTGTSRTLTLESTGTGSLNPTALAAAAPLSIAEGLDASIAPATSDDFTIDFFPTAPGTISRAVTFGTDDPIEGNFTINFSADVRPGNINLTRSGSPVSDGATIALGQVSSGASPTLTFRVANTGTGNLLVTGVTGGVRTTFSEPLNSVIAPATFDEFTVALDTTALGGLDELISIQSNDVGEPSYDIRITGTVANPVAVLETLAGTPVPNGGGPFTFGPAAISSTAPTMNFRLRNTGVGTLSVSGTSAPTGFSLTGLASSIPQGGSDEFTVSLLTSTAGNFSGNISISNNDVDNTPYLFAVSGRVDAATTLATAAVVDTDMLNSPAAGYSNNPTVSINTTFTGQTPTAVEVSLNSGFTAPTLIPYAGTVSYTLPAEGSYTLWIRLRNGAYVSPSVSRTMVVDTTPPVPTWTTADRTIIGNLVNLTCLCTDANIGGSRLDIYRKLPGESSLTIRFPNLSSGGGTIPDFYSNTGQIVYGMVCEDLAGNQNSPMLETVIWKNSSDDTALTLPVDGNGSIFFPMTPTLDIEMAISGFVNPTSITVSRATGISAPAGLNAAHLLRERLTITSPGLEGASAMIRWPYASTSASHMTRPIDTIFQSESGVVVQTYPVPAANPLVFGPVTTFSVWYAGSAAASVDDWMLLED